MGKPQRKKRTHKNVKDFKKSHRTRNRTKDVDQIHDEIDLIPFKKNNILHQLVDPDLPGDGQFYCVICARYFMDGKNLSEHKKTKNHKKRLRVMKEKPYSVAESQMAAGMGSYTINPNIKPIGEKTLYNEFALDAPTSQVEDLHID
ncbi:zinc finger protein 593 [Hydra vulgaris]|uniref:zinc finger protein 593 n=1 Tax=Hydra vulgaris TaxID=6087 RepID=UPI001F5FDA01|nr:zinc finger protein 593 [Hydra vulgaris]